MVTLTSPFVTLNSSFPWEEEGQAGRPIESVVVIAADAPMMFLMPVPSY